MTASLSFLWDGEKHELEPGDQFNEDGATLVIDGWEEQEEEDVLSPFESPSRTPILRDTGMVVSERYSERFPFRKLEQAWGSLSVNLGALATILGIERKQYQEVDHKNKTVAWTFQATEGITERL